MHPPDCSVQIVMSVLVCHLTQGLSLLCKTWRRFHVQTVGRSAGHPASMLQTGFGGILSPLATVAAHAVSQWKYNVSVVL